MLRIAEIFESLQGEGERVGIPSVFVRTSGCNLRCRWCDTPYASWAPEGDRHAWDDLAANVLGREPRDVVLTGGEPMLLAELMPLAHAVHEAGRTITIETAGTVLPPGFLPSRLPCDLMSISPKLANSTPDGAWHDRHEARRDATEVIETLVANYRHQLKFVIEQPGDVDDVAAWLRRFPMIAGDRVFLMAQATDALRLAEITTWLQPLAEERGWRVSPRLHVELWGDARGV